jgi:bacillolysin
MMVQALSSVTKMKHAGRVLTVAVVVAAGISGLSPALAATNPVDKAANALLQAAGASATLTRDPQTGVVTFLSGANIAVAGANAKAQAAAFIGTYGAAFGMTGATFVGGSSDELGLTHVRFQQTAGVPVSGAELTVHLRGSVVTAVSARTASLLNGVNTVPAITATRAGNLAKGAVSKRHNLTTTVSATTPQLVVFVPTLFGGPARPARLAYFVEVYTSEVRDFVWVDAMRGYILLCFSQEPDALQRQVFDAAGGNALPGTLARSEGGAATGNTDVDDAYDSAGDFYNYLLTQYGRDSYDGKGTALVSSVRYCPSGATCPYSNAFWNGRSGQVVFGAGMAQADDIVAHEWTHALVENTANLFNYRQSGSLGESFADFFGELVDLGNGRGNDSGAVRWQIGEDLPGGAVRNMSDPAAFGQAASTSDANYACGAADDGGVHANSGVLNHAFALMTDGGTYPATNGTSVTGIGETKAGQIAYRALTRYLTSASNFGDADRALRQSCSDLVGGTAGITADDCTQVGAALDAVALSASVCAPAPEPPFCGAGYGPLDTLYDGFEDVGTAGRWATSVTVGANGWAGGSGTPNIYFTDFPNTGFYSLRGADLSVASDSAVSLAKAVVVPAGGLLEIQHYYAFEPDMDGGVVEYSADNGVTWLDAETLRTAGADYGPNPLSMTSGNPLGGRRAFTGFSGKYVATQYDLSALAGQSIRVRFRVGTDSSVGYEGWFIDDVHLYRCDVGGTFRMATDRASVAEAAGSVKLSVTRDLTTGAAGGVVIGYATTDVTATAGLDYVSTSGTLTFASGVASQSFTVPILNDTLDDSGETFDVGLSVVSGPTATIGVPASTIVTLVNDDAAGSVRFAAAAYTVNENAGEVDIQVQRLGGAASGVTVQYSTVQGSGPAGALAGYDYGDASKPGTEVVGTLSFGAGQTVATARIPIIDDCLVQPTHSFKVVLSSPTGNATLGGRTSVAVSIVDNDAGGVLAFGPGPFWAYEATRDSGGNPVPGAVTVNVVRTQGAACGVTVDYATADGTAVAGTRYQETHGTLSFGKGETTKSIVVPLIDNAIADGNATFNVILRNPQGGAKLGTSTQTTCTVADDETGVQFAQSQYHVSEGAGTVYFDVVRTGPLKGTTTVQYKVEDGTAVLGENYRLYGSNPGVLTFLPNVSKASILILMVDDQNANTRRDFTMSLFNPIGALLAPQATAAVSISDNDAGGYVEFLNAGLPVARNAGQAKVTVLRKNGTAGGVTVECYTQEMNPVEAVAGANYVETTQTLTFGPGETGKPCIVPILNADLPHGNDEFWLKLRNAKGATVGASDHERVGIYDTEDMLTFFVPGNSSYEQNGGPMRILRHGTGAGTIWVDVATRDGTAIRDVDYRRAKGTVTFPPGVMYQTLNLTFIDNRKAQPNRYFYITMSNIRDDTPTGHHWRLPANPTATYTIIDDDYAGHFALSAPEYVTVEGKPATISVNRLDAVADNTADRVNFNLDVSGGSATPSTPCTTTPCPPPDGDYVLPSANPVPASFRAWTTSWPMTIRTVADGAVKGVKTVNITLTPQASGFPDAAVVTQGSAVLYINDADAPGFTFTTGTVNGANVSARTYTVSESTPTTTITVTRSGSTAAAATVDYDVAPGTVTPTTPTPATPDVDFKTDHGTLTFAAGQASRTFQVQIVNNDMHQPTRSVRLTLSNPSSGYVLAYPYFADLNITDDDPAVLVSFQNSAGAALEGTRAAIKVVRSNGASGSVTVHWATTTGGTATPCTTDPCETNADYMPADGTVSFAAGQTEATVYVQLLDDGTIKPDNSISLALDSPGGGAVLAPPYYQLLWRIDTTPPPPPPPATTENVVWTSAAGVSVSGDNLTKTATRGWGNAGAVSTRAIATGDGYVETKVLETNSARMFGLSNGDTNQDYADIDFGLLLNGADDIRVYEGGAQKGGSYGTYAAGDMMRVAVVGGVVEYSKNGVVFYTSQVRPTYPLLVDTALSDQGSTLQSVVIFGSLQ